MIKMIKIPKKYIDIVTKLGFVHIENTINYRKDNITLTFEIIPRSIGNDLFMCMNTNDGNGFCQHYRNKIDGYQPVFTKPLSMIETDINNFIQKIQKS